MTDKEIIKFYDLKLALGDDIYINGIKILNYKISVIKDLIYNEIFVGCMKIITKFMKGDADTHEISYCLSNLLDCEYVDYKVPLNTYIAYLEDENGEVIVKQLSKEDVKIIFVLLSEMYARGKTLSSDLIDESKAADEETREKIKKINENKKKYEHAKIKSNVTLQSIIKKCAALNLGGYNFETIQDLTFYQVRCLADAHDSNSSYMGYYSGLYSQVDLKEVDHGGMYWANDD